MIRYPIRTKTGWAELLLDDADAERVRARKWRIDTNQYGRAYARTGVKQPNGKWKSFTLGPFVFGGPCRHQNDNRLDACRENLVSDDYRVGDGSIFGGRRGVMTSELARKYARKRRKGNQYTSKFRGVWFQKTNGGRKPWIAQMKHDSQGIFIGAFTTEIEAALAYDAKIVEMFGAKARVNIGVNPVVSLKQTNVERGIELLAEADKWNKREWVEHLVKGMTGMIAYKSGFWPTPTRIGDG
jgi:hypothetical protein